MSEKGKSSKGKLLYFPPYLSVHRDKQMWIRREFVPGEQEPAWLTVAMLRGRARRVVVHAVEQMWVPQRGGRRTALWVASLLSHDTLFPPLRLTPRLCREFAAAVGLPHPRHWVGWVVWLVPRCTRGGQWMIKIVNS